MNTQWPLIPDLIAAASNRLKLNWKTLLGLQVISILSGYITAAIVSLVIVLSIRTQSLVLLKALLFVGIPIILVIIIQLFISCATIVVLSHQKKIRLLSPLLFKTTLKMVPTYLTVTVLTLLLSFGGLGLLVIPGILTGILLSFGLYEAVLFHKKGTIALKSSAQIFSQHWRQIVVSHLPLIAVYFAIGIIFSIIQALCKTIGIPTLIPSLGRLVVNVIFGLFTINLNFEIYLAAKKRTDEEKHVALWTPMLLTAIIGWIIIVCLIALPFLFGRKKSSTLSPKSTVPTATFVPLQRE